jgi:hypothetical protein
MGNVPVLQILSYKMKNALVYKHKIKKLGCPQNCESCEGGKCNKCNSESTMDLVVNCDCKAGYYIDN